VSKFAVKNMSAGHGKNTLAKELVLASALIALGLAICGLSVAQLRANNPQLAQATQPLQQAPETETKPTAKPAEPATTGTRPTTPAPEPARPDADAQKSGAQPALPPAPAEKTAPPIKDR
jgi:hypothetical protein